MTIDQLRAAQQAKPFRPFTLHLADGDVLTVPHQEFVAASPAGRTIIVFGPDDQMSIVDLLLVTRIQFVKAGGTNGRKRR